MIEWAGFSGISATVASGEAARPGDADFPYTGAEPLTPAAGPLTGNNPVDVVSRAGTGHLAPDGYLEWWQQCMTLFMRHI